MAYVVPAGSVDADDLRRRVGRRLADYKVPDRVILLEEMPLTAVGKIDRRALTELAMAPPAGAVG